MNSVVTQAVRCLAVILWAACSSQACMADDSAWKAFEARRIDLLRELTLPVEDCVSRVDTNHSVFHGCVDWHSAVHGHWALLRVYRITEDEGFLETVRHVLTPAAMRQEHEFLAANPRFEMPYGRAWFLKLIHEYELAAGDEQYRYFGDAIAQTLRDYLMPRPCNLQRPTYSNQSWAYRQLLEYYEHVGARDRLFEVTEKVSRCSAPQISFDNDRLKPEFFSVYGNLAHLFEWTLDDDTFEQWHAAHQPSPESLEPVRKLGTAAHHLGINFARAWGMWSLYHRTGNERYRNAYLDNINEAMDHHEAQKDSYHKYGRWVPQFGIYAISASLLD